MHDTNGIENFVKNFAKSYYTWDNSKEAIEKRTALINEYLKKELQSLNVDTIRTDIPTSSIVSNVQIWKKAQETDGTVDDETMQDGENVKVSVSVKFLDNQTKAIQTLQFELVLHKDGNWKIVNK